MDRNRRKRLVAHPRWIRNFAKKELVYNVTGYLNEHPGGEEILQGVAGKDATAAFEDAAHSDDAFETMEKLLVGKLPPHVSLFRRLT